MSYEFNDTRATLQREKDARFHYGWVEFAEKGLAAIRLREPMAADIGETFMVEVHGPRRIATFRGTLWKTEDAILHFSTDQVVYKPPRENFRLVLNDKVAEIVLDGETTTVRLLDVSLLGVALRLFMPVKGGEVLTIRMDSIAGDIEFRGEVRYCRKDPDAPSTYRAGIMITEMGRIERARWLRSFETQEAA